MSERYWISGVDLGVLISLKSPHERRILIDKIVDKQFICNCETEKKQKEFLKRIEKL